VLMDLAVAAGFWVAAMTVLYAVSRVLMYLLKQPTPKTIPTELQALAPQSALGFALWLVLSISAGMCEEFVFRGYLQRQFTALARNAGAGIVISALVFSVGHLYEGGVKAIVIGIFGILLGVLAHARRSLAPGMIAHAWHDIFAGALLYLLPRMLPH
jgi:membrane protease YdiL (CAAX protease family)